MQDGTTNDIPSDFTVEGYPTMYFYSSAGNLLSYEGGRTAADIIDFIKKNKGSRPGEAAVVDGVVESVAVEDEGTASSESVKDEVLPRCVSLKILHLEAPVFCSASLDTQLIEA